MTVKLERETHKVDRYADGDARLQISIKFLPRSEQIYKNLKYLSGMIKKLPGVLSVSIDVYNKRLITSKGSKIVF
jgi:hypothetical protein